MAQFNRNKTLSRRDWLRVAGTLGGLAALAPLLEACSRAGLSPTEITESSAGSPLAPTALNPRPTMPAEGDPTTPPAPAQATATSESAGPGFTQVAFVKTNDRLAGVRQAIALLESNPVAGKTVFLKPNFNSSDPAPGSTHPDVLTGLVLALQEMGAGKITVGDRSGMGDTGQVLRELGIPELADRLGFELLNFDDLGKEDWVLVTPAGSHWKFGFPFARLCLECGAVVQTCCLKTHRFGGHFTLSLKNSVGMVADRIPTENYAYMNELHTSRHQRRMIAEINSAYNPDLIVLDGVEAFVSGGPDRGEKVQSQVILAGTDRIAIDALGVALLRYHGCQTEAAEGKIFEQEQIARAVELGLGVDSPEKIQLLAPDRASQAYAAEIQAILAQG